MNYWRAEEEHLLRLLVPTNSINEIAVEFERRFEANLPGFAALRTAYAIRRKCSRDNITAESCHNYTNPFKGKWQLIQEIADEYRLLAEVKSVGLLEPEEATRKILAISDFHFPFAREDLLQDILTQHADSNIVVVNGDLLDGHAYSSFTKDRRVAALHEYMQAYELVAYLASNFPRVILVSGNHDARPALALQRFGLDHDATQLLRPDLLARIANGERLDESGEIISLDDFSNVTYQQSENWYVRIGKTIFAHPSAFSGGYPGGTAVRLDKYFAERLGNDAFDSLVVAHTHRIYKGVICGRMLIEQGALCARQPYEHKCNLRFSNSMNGYAVIYQDKNGNTDFNQSQVYYLGTEMPPKKAIL